MSLRGRVAIVTGASRGIGRAAALKLAEAGASVALASRSLPHLEQVAGEIAAKGGRAIPLVVDVADEGQVRAAVARVARELGGVDILVNCAGISTEARDLVDLPAAAWDRVVAVNLRGTMLCCKYALEHMAPRRTGTIINVASTAARKGMPGQSACAASHWAVHGLTLSLAWEAGKHDIRVQCVAAGTAVTGGQAMAGGQSFLDRVPTEAEVAELIAYLAEDSSVALAGQAINVNAGSWMT